MAASGRAVRSNSKSTGMNADIEVWQPREKVSTHRLYIGGGGGYYLPISDFYIGQVAVQ